MSSVRTPKQSTKILQPMHLPVFFKLCLHPKREYLLGLIAEASRHYFFAVGNNYCGNALHAVFLNGFGMRFNIYPLDGKPVLPSRRIDGGYYRMTVYISMSFIIIFLKFPLRLQYVPQKAAAYLSADKRYRVYRTLQRPSYDREELLFF